MKFKSGDIVYNKKGTMFMVEYLLPGKSEANLSQIKRAGPNYYKVTNCGHRAIIKVCDLIPKEVYETPLGRAIYGGENGN